MLNALEKIAKIISLVAIPIILGVLGYIYQAAFESDKISLEYVKLSLEILKNKNEVDPYLSDWAVETLNHYSEIAMSPELRTSLKQGVSSVDSSSAVSGWFAVIGSIETQSEAESLVKKLMDNRPKDLQEYKLCIYRTKISGLVAVTIGSEISKSEAIKRARLARDKGWVPDAFAQRNLGWTKIT